MAIPPSYTINQRQEQTAEIARIRQLIYEGNLQINNLQQQMMLFGSSISTQEDANRYAQTLLELNSLKENVQRYYSLLGDVTNMPQDTTRALSDELKREIYHLYYSGRYKQDELASQYGIGQSTISKIVNDHNNSGQKRE